LVKPKKPILSTSSVSAPIDAQGLAVAPRVLSVIGVIDLRRLLSNSAALIRRNAMDLKLEGKTALVTGASIGIGRGIALALAREGVRVAIMARRRDLLEEVAGEIASTRGGPPVIIAEDFMQEGAPERIAKAALDGLGSVDILINNAGGSRPFKLDATEEQWYEAMTLNFTRQRQLTHRLLDQMMARKWGRILNITGKSEPDGINGAFAAKAAIHSWAKGLSRDVGKHGITVNCLPPGRINSEQIRRNYTPEYRQWQADNEIPVGRYGEPEDMANIVCFLASPLAGYITGTVIPVDGGLRRYQF
jgi:3-oxoacyl-[acyl-carrier protein] reductase